MRRVGTEPVARPADAERVAGRVHNAGAIFVGAWSPVSLGDYCAGSTHVLPTGGCACHSSGLNVKSFLKAVNQVRYTRDALAEVTVVLELEGVEATGQGVSPDTMEASGRSYLRALTNAVALIEAGEKTDHREPAEATEPAPAS